MSNKNNLCAPNVGSDENGRGEQSEHMERAAGQPAVLQRVSKARSLGHPLLHVNEGRLPFAAVFLGKVNPLAADSF